MAGKFLVELQSALARNTPSVIAYGDATFPKGTAFGGGGKVSGIAQRRPLGGAVFAKQRLRGSYRLLIALTRARTPATMISVSVPAPHVTVLSPQTRPT